MNTNIYIEFIRNTISAEGWKVADKANKIALSENQITSNILYTNICISQLIQVEQKYELTFIYISDIVL